MCLIHNVSPALATSYAMNRLSPTRLALAPGGEVIAVEWSRAGRDCVAVVLVTLGKYLFPRRGGDHTV